MFRSREGREQLGPAKRVEASKPRGMLSRRRVITILGVAKIAVGLSLAGLTGTLKNAGQALTKRLRQDAYTDLVALAVQTAPTPPDKSALQKAIGHRVLRRYAAHLASPAARPRLHCDVEVEPGGFSPALVRELAQLGPFGPGNPEPTVVLRRLRVASARVVGADHLKLLLTGGGAQHDAIGFRMGSLESRGLSPAGPVDIACVLEINAWNGMERVQLRLKDVRASGHG